MAVRRRLNPSSELTPREETDWQHAADHAAILAASEGRQQPQPGAVPLPVLLLSLILARVFAAYCCPIADCDETFNYWEPMHYLVYGHGLQTWEYSPPFALRSYAYLAVHAVVAWTASLLSPRKPVVFFVTRAALGVASACSEARLLVSVDRGFGSAVSSAMWLLVLGSAGMFHAAVSFVPSAFAMVCLNLAFAKWMDARIPMPTPAPPPPSSASSASSACGSGSGSLSGSASTSALSAGSPSALSLVGAIWSVAVAVLLGWPFVALLGLPLAIDAIAAVGLRRFLSASMVAGASLLLPMVAIDSFFYGRLAVAPLNILRYNSSASAGAGAQLYGVEAWHFYFKNLLLNFNLALPAALLSPLLAAASAAISRRSRTLPPANAPALPAPTAALLLCGGGAWLAFFSTVPHKEERFMYPVYPLLCLAAAIGFAASARIAAAALARLRGPKSTSIERPLLGLLVGACCLLSASRSAALLQYYGAPLRLYSLLERELAATNSKVAGFPGLVCVGKEWYRAPGSFFLPSADFRLGFLRSGFRGLLPSPFTAPPPEGSRAVPSHFNDINREEPAQYAQLRECDWLVDLRLPGDEMLSGFRREEWEVPAALGPRLFPS